jgi:biopolymer transport protein ExbB
MWGESFQALFLRGGPVMWPLLLCSVLALAVAVERLMLFLWWTTPYEAFLQRLQATLSKGNREATRRMLRECRSPLARVAEAYLAHLRAPAARREESVARDASYRITQLERRLNWLSVIGHLAPMIGLLGTVVGLVDAFHQIELLGGQVQPSHLASGIWAALLTTVFGLSVALPTLAVHHFLDHRAATVALQMQWLVAHLNEWLLPHDGNPAEPIEADLLV